MPILKLSRPNENKEIAFAVACLRSLTTKQWFQMIVGVIFLVVCWLQAPVSCLAATVYLKDGRVVEGEVVERTDRRITVKSEFGPIVSYRTEDVARIIEEDKPKAQPGAPQGDKPSQETSAPSKELSPVEIFERVAPAVVIVITRKISGEEVQASGFIVDPKGIVVTCLHSVLGAQEGQIKLADGRVFPIRGMFGLGRLDLSVLKVDAAHLTAVTFTDEEIKPGERVFVIGSPLGLEYSISDGLLSGIRFNSGAEILQVTTPLSPGSSGSPLINAKGQVVGIVKGGPEIGQPMNFAISAAQLKPHLDSIPDSSFMPLGQWADMAPGLQQLSVPAPLTGPEWSKQDVRSYNTAEAKKLLMQQKEDYAGALYESNRMLELCEGYGQEQSCHAELLEVINLLAFIGSTRFQEKFPGENDLAGGIRAAEPYSKQCLQVIESHGGIKQVVSHGERVFGKGEFLINAKAHTFGGCYEMAGMAYVADGDERNARHCLKILKQLAPNSKDAWEPLEEMLRQLPEWKAQADTTGDWKNP